MNTNHPNYVHSIASIAAYILARKSTESFSFISEWFTHAQDSRALTNSSNVFDKEDYEDFIDHCHDQSIFDLL
jgi:hypothetical protein